MLYLSGSMKPPNVAHTNIPERNFTMTVDEVKAATAALAQQITQQVQAFEASTDCIIHSIPIIPATKTAPASAQVKVQV